MSAPAGRPRAALAMDARTRTALLTPALTRRLAELCAVDTDRLVTTFADSAADLATIDVLFTSWGVPIIDEAALAAMPALSAIVHGAGSVKHFVTPAVFERGIAVSSAAVANAIPVAEFTLAAIISAAKQVRRFAAGFREHRSFGAWDFGMTDLGSYGITVGVVGASRIGRLVIEMLGRMDVEILVADPMIDADEAVRLGVRCTDLDTLAASSDIVTLHVPSLPATYQLLDARRLALMRDGCTVINTARGALIDTAALTAELVTGRLDAVLDVTDPEPLPADSPLFELPNVQLTPHIAGSLGNEIARMGALAVAEIGRFADGLPFEHPVTAASLGVIA